MFLISNQKACKTMTYRPLLFVFVDKRIEISNLEIIRDMDKIVKLEEVLVNSKLLSP